MELISLVILVVLYILQEVLLTLYVSELKRKYKEERKKILEKNGRPMSEILDEELKDENGWVWLRDSVDYK